jgi:hypothetical protein
VFSDWESILVHPEFLMSWVMLHNNFLISGLFDELLGLPLSYSNFVIEETTFTCAFPDAQNYLSIIPILFASDSCRFRIRMIKRMLFLMMTPTRIHSHINQSHALRKEKL